MMKDVLEHESAGCHMECELRNPISRRKRAYNRARRRLARKVVRVRERRLIGEELASWLG